MQDSDIAWHYDRDHLYGHYLSQNYNNVPAFRGGNTTTTFIDESQHFMVWMRPDVHSSVRKLYGVINQDILGGVRCHTPCPVPSCNECFQVAKKHSDRLMRQSAGRLL